jgi:hypothetical protein
MKYEILLFSTSNKNWMIPFTLGSGMGGSWGWLARDCAIIAVK